MNQLTTEQCQAEVWGSGSPSHRCKKAAIPRRWVDSYESVVLCRTHARAADKGLGVWVLNERHPTVGQFYKPGRLYKFRPGFEKEEKA
jgi:hypothetical protein